MRNAIFPMISSVRSGASGPRPDAARCFTVLLPLWTPSSVLEDERDHEPDQGQSLGQREADVHVGPDQAGRLRLPGHRLDAVTEYQADADAGDDGGQAVRNCADVDADDALGRSSGSKVDEIKHGCFPLRSSRRISPGGSIAEEPVPPPGAPA